MEIYKHDSSAVISGFPFACAFLMGRLDIVDDSVYSRFPERVAKALQPASRDDPFEKVSRMELAAFLRVIMNATLTTREIDMLWRHCVDEETLEDIGNSYSRSRETVRRVVDGALRKLRRPHLDMSSIKLTSWWTRNYRNFFQDG